MSHNTVSFIEITSATNVWLNTACKVSELFSISLSHGPRVVTSLCRDLKDFHRRTDHTSIQGSCDLASSHTFLW